MHLHMHTRAHTCTHRHTHAHTTSHDLLQSSYRTHLTKESTNSINLFRNQILYTSAGFDWFALNPRTQDLTSCSQPSNAVYDG